MTDEERDEFLKALMERDKDNEKLAEVASSLSDFIRERAKLWEEFSLCFPPAHPF